MSFIKSLSAKRTFSNGTSVGSMYVCPSYTVIIAFFNVSKSESLSIYPSQLKSIALIKYSISLWIVRTITLQSIFWVLIMLSTWSPSRLGILISRSITSGCVLSARLRHSNPSPASPTTLISSYISRSCFKPSLIILWSSASKILTDILFSPPKNYYFKGILITNSFSSLL